MRFTRHYPADVPPPVGGYVQGLEVPAGTRLLFVSGQIPVRPDGTVPEGQPRSMVGCAASGWVRPGPRSPS